MLQLWSTTIIYGLNVQARLGGDTYALLQININVSSYHLKVTLLAQLLARHKSSLRFDGESYVAGENTGLYS